MATRFADRTSLAGGLIVLSVRLKDILKRRNTNRHCAYGQVASEGSNHLVGVAMFCSMVHATAVKSRELFNAQTFEGLTTAGVVSHCDSGGLGWS
jgi:hypothetical protein